MNESHRIEYKQKLTGSLEKEVVAFLNANEGGVVYIGVDKSGKVCGVDDADEVQLKIKDKLKHNISPSCLGLFEVILEQFENKNIIKIIVASGRETPFTEDGHYNYVAYLLADNNGTSIKVAKYAGTDKVDLIENNEYGYCSLIKATHKVLDKLDVENKTAAKITYKQRLEQPLWNKVALREAVINAIVHNDYTTEIPPVFEIYSDRIEITSSGGFSSIKNKDDFFEGYSKRINRELMRIYKDLEMVEHLGSGLDRILKAYDKESFNISRNFMKNIFYKIDGGVNGGVNELLQYIEKKPGLKANEMSENLHIPLRTVQRWLKQLKDEETIEFKGAPKTGGYFAK